MFEIIHTAVEILWQIRRGKLGKKGRAQLGEHIMHRKKIRQINYRKSIKEGG